MGGKVVHAVGGRRAHYQPITSVLHARCEPVALARAVEDALGLAEFYLADLDAIAGAPPRIDILQELLSWGFRLWIDAGISDRATMTPLLDLDPAKTTIVAGLETLSGPLELAEIVETAGADRVVFSLDLFDNRPRIANRADWETEDPFELARAAIARGVRKLLILDLARVGTGRGSASRDLIARIRSELAPDHLITGGGIARIDEILELRDDGVSSVLVGSAIHNGQIGRGELERISHGES